MALEKYLFALEKLAEVRRRMLWELSEHTDLHEDGTSFETIM